MATKKTGTLKKASKAVGNAAKSVGKALGLTGAKKKKPSGSKTAKKSTAAKKPAKKTTKSKSK